MSLADLPTPVSSGLISTGSKPRAVSIKHDDVTGIAYGGNKLRKLEYILQHARKKGARRVATFGTVGSNHAVATAIYATRAGFECTCFLSHQSPKPGLDNALRYHLQIGTEIVRYGGNRAARVKTMRKYAQGRNTWVVPLGGSSWLGAVGYVNAGLELAAQIEAGELPQPARIYIATGTMGTAAGLVLGLALSGLEIETHAIRVTETMYANEVALQRLVQKTAALLHAIDPAIPANLASQVRLELRNEFFGTGYGHTNAATEHAIELARDELGLSLESTYTGKAMAGLLHDVSAGFDEPILFWNTFNSRPIALDANLEPDYDRLPKEFARYFD
jgi:D-cysteine desulfhydrase